MVCLTIYLQLPFTKMLRHDCEYPEEFNTDDNSWVNIPHLNKEGIGIK